MHNWKCAFAPYPHTLIVLIPMSQVSINGSFAYCPQQAWIQSSTVQENILFGKPMDASRLKRAIGAASFAADLERLPNGIASEVAERGK
jgi:ABC-type multidrug transport system fused ATPase/permease subunit